MRFVNVAFVTLDSATLLYTYISRFSVNPHYISRGRKSGKAAAINFIPQPLFNFLHKRPTFDFTGEIEYTLGFRRKIAHKGLHGETGLFRMERYYYPRYELHVYEHPRAGYQNGVLWRFWVLIWCAPEERRKPAEQQCAHARRCSEASRPRWTA